MGCQSSDFLNTVNISSDLFDGSPNRNQQNQGQNNQNQQYRQAPQQQQNYQQQPQQQNYQQQPQQQYYQQQPQQYQQPQSYPQPPPNNQIQPQQQNYSQPPSDKQIQLQAQQLFNLQPKDNMSQAQPPIEIRPALKKPTIIKKKQAPRQFMQKQANKQQDFETHHLRYELSLSNFSSKSKIKRRQIVQHMMLMNFWGNNGLKGVNVTQYHQALLMSFLQRNFLEIWETGHEELFVQHLPEKDVRRKIAEQYMFEIYELKEYVDSGLANLNFFIDKTKCLLNEFMIVSDFALFNTFKKLKDKYPQTSETEKIQFPKVDSTKTNYNLLEHFESKCFADPKNINLQTIYDDLNYMFSKAIELEQNFKADMKQMLGEKTLACAKVNISMDSGRPEFNACAVRRVFVKWAQNLIELFPEIKSSKGFAKFIRIKNELANNFIFKSQLQQTTHKKVIDVICQLIEVAKYHLKDGQKRKEFLFNIYDLLRCKIKKNSAQEVVELYNKMVATKITKSGQKFEVLRVKNRFQTNNRDLLVNYKYGDLIVGEAQLCIDTANVSKEAKLNYQFNHYIYELERSLFGPTLELMMSYEDFQRPDIFVSFQAQNLVLPRGDQLLTNLEKTDRLCMLGHQMVSLKGNYIIGEDPAIELTCTCDYCGTGFSTNQKYDYCFFCSNCLCKGCSGHYKQNFKHQNNWNSILRDEVMIKITDRATLESECGKNKSLAVLYYAEGTTSANQMFKDCLTFYQSRVVSQDKIYVPKVAIANVNNQAIKSICDGLHIKEFPAFVLYDTSANPIRTLIGFHWLEVPIIYETQKKMLQKNSFELQMTCSKCAHENLLQFRQLEEGQQFGCLYCYNTNKLDLIPPEYHNIGGFCPEGHYRCIACSYAACDKPSAYKDYTGGKYLTSPIIVPKLRKCPKGHETKLVKKNQLKVWEYSCFSCMELNLFDDENGVGYCETCKISVCPKCMGFSFETMQQLTKSSALAIHYAESSAEEAVLCACKQHFKKSYTTRMLSIDAMIENTQSKWLCCLCKQQKQSGELHIGCFNCPAMFQISGQKGNLQICITCAEKSELMKREKTQKVKQLPSFFVCNKNHIMVKTSLSYDQKALTISCMFCKKNYYSHTERLYCRTCNVNCCNDCKQKLVNANPPKCNQVCKNGHLLSLSYKCDTLRFCDCCYKVVKDEYFNCKDCGFDLCLGCANQPGPLNYTLNIQDLKPQESQWLNFQQNFGEVKQNYDQESSQDWSF